MPKTTDSLPPSLLYQWLSSLPYPALVIGEDKEVLLANDASKETFSILSSESAKFDPDYLLSLVDDVDRRKVVSAKSLEPGEFFATAISVDERGIRYFLRAVRLEHRGRIYFCCVLTPTNTELQISAVLDTVNCSIVHCNPTGEIENINRFAIALLGFDRDTDEITHLRDIDASFDPLAFREVVHTIMREGSAQYDTQYRKKSGELIPMKITAIRDALSNKFSIIITAQDVSLQRHRENELNDALQTIKSLTQPTIDRKSLTLSQLDGKRKHQLVYVSEAFQGVVNNIERVAPTSATVLILGETGTGKEVVARTIHQLSLRAQKPFVVVDCGSLPASLIESELFGYRRGAFTGALQDRAGKFEVADGGTIFLNEIGEMPLELQSRLLRVLQEREFYRIGDSKPRKVDARIIAATNRNLATQVREGTFRSDLYFRLNVFPIYLAPLRDRPDDIVALLHYFIEKFNQRFNKQVDKDGLSESDLEGFKAYPFPGNVRELENIVERAFISAKGNTLDFQFSPGGSRRILNSKPEELIDHGGQSSGDGQSSNDGQDQSTDQFLTFEEFQRQYIERVLKSTGGKVSGEGGAAEVLNLNPQTLFSKMKKLGIKR